MFVVGYLLMIQIHHEKFFKSENVPNKNDSNPEINFQSQLKTYCQKAPTASKLHISGVKL